MGRHEKLTGAQRFARRRATLRAQGLRPLQFWLPDLRDPTIQGRIADEVAAINASAHEEADTARIDAISARDVLPDYDWGDGGPPITQAANPETRRDMDGIRRTQLCR